VDQHQLQQVLLNLINNAQDAIVPGSKVPRITVRTEQRGELVAIVVEDNGSGISKGNLKKVFDPFFTTKPVGKGTGLGLSISYGIIREHGGEISLQSEVGMGTQVLIQLPVHHHAPPVMERQVRCAILDRQMRILVVDDEPEIVSLLRAGLSRSNLTVDSACTISDAVSLAATNTYDFVLTDVKMPGGSGMDLYKRLCGVNGLYRQRTAFLTGDTSNPRTVEFLEQEGLVYFAKPFDFEAIERYLSSERSVADRAQA
jgi:CheY-like chemotaxis protein